MLQFPLFIPTKVLGQGMGNIMFVTNPINTKKYFVAMSVEPTNRMLEVMGLDSIKKVKSKDELLKLYNNITFSGKNDIEGIAVYNGDCQQYYSLR